MATNWDREMQDRFETLQRDLTRVIVGEAEKTRKLVADAVDQRLGKAEARLERHIDGRFIETEARLEKHIDGRFVEAEMRLEKHIDKSVGELVQVHAEGLEAIARTSAANYGGVLDAIKREFAEFRQDTRTQVEDIKGILDNHNKRITTLEARR